MTEDEIRQMIADREAGTEGPFQGVGWTPPGIYGPGGLSDAVRLAQMDHRLPREAVRADARRFLRVPELEAEVIRLREALADARKRLKGAGMLGSDEHD